MSRCSKHAPVITDELIFPEAHSGLQLLADSSEFRKQNRTHGIECGQTIQCQFFVYFVLCVHPPFTLCYEPDANAIEFVLLSVLQRREVGITNKEMRMYTRWMSSFADHRAIVIDNWYRDVLTTIGSPCDAFGKVSAVDKRNVCKEIHRWISNPKRMFRGRPLWDIVDLRRLHSSFGDEWPVVPAESVVVVPVVVVPVVVVPVVVVPVMVVPVVVVPVVVVPVVPVVPGEVVDSGTQLGKRKNSANGSPSKIRGVADSGFGQSDASTAGSPGFLMCPLVLPAIDTETTQGGSTEPYATLSGPPCKIRVVAQPGVGQSGVFTEGLPVLVTHPLGLPTTDTETVLEQCATLIVPKADECVTDAPGVSVPWTDGPLSSGLIPMEETCISLAPAVCDAWIELVRAVKPDADDGARREPILGLGTQLTVDPPVAMPAVATNGAIIRPTIQHLIDTIMANLVSYDIDVRSRGVKKIMETARYLWGEPVWAPVFETIYMMHQCEPCESLRRPVYLVTLEMKKSYPHERPVQPDEARILEMALARNTSWVVAMANDLDRPGQELQTFRLVVQLSSIKSSRGFSGVLNSTLQHLRISMMPTLLRGMALYPDEIKRFRGAIHMEDLVTDPALVRAVLIFRQSTPPAINDLESMLLINAFEACRLECTYVRVLWKEFQEHPQFKAPSTCLERHVLYFRENIHALNLLSGVVLEAFTTGPPGPLAPPPGFPASDPETARGYSTEPVATLSACGQGGECLTDASGASVPQTDRPSSSGLFKTEETCIFSAPAVLDALEDMIPAGGPDADEVARRDAFLDMGRRLPVDPIVVHALANRVSTTCQTKRKQQEITCQTNQQEFIATLMANFASYDEDTRVTGVHKFMALRRHSRGEAAWDPVFETLYMMHQCDPYFVTRTTIKILFEQVAKIDVCERPGKPDEARVLAMAFARNRSWADALANDLDRPGQELQTFKVIVRLSSMKHDDHESSFTETLISTLKHLRISIMPMLLRGMALYPDQIKRFHGAIRTEDFVGDPALVRAVLSVRQATPSATNDIESMLLIKALDACRLDSTHVLDLWAAFQAHPQLRTPGTVWQKKVFDLEKLHRRPKPKSCLNHKYLKI